MPLLWICAPSVLKSISTCSGNISSRIFSNFFVNVDFSYICRYSPPDICWTCLVATIVGVCNNVLVSLGRLVRWKGNSCKVLRIIFPCLCVKFAFKNEFFNAIFIKSPRFCGTLWFSFSELDVLFCSFTLYPPSSSSFSAWSSSSSSSPVLSSYSVSSSETSLSLPVHCIVPHHFETHLHRQMK